MACSPVSCCGTRGLLFPTRGRFQCVLGQFYIGLWALWDNYIWEERHTTYTTYKVDVTEYLFLFSMKVCVEDFYFFSSRQSFHLLVEILI